MIASRNTVMQFMSTSEGFALAKAFMRIRSTPLRRRIVELVEGIGGWATTIEDGIERMTERHEIELALRSVLDD
jgi:hypothetical protein